MNTDDAENKQSRLTGLDRSLSEPSQRWRVVLPLRPLTRFWRALKRWTQVLARRW